MRRLMGTLRKAIAIACVAAWGASFMPAATAQTAESAAGRALLKQTGVTGGLVVHVGCGNGALTAALCAGDAFLVHGLDADAARVAAARERVARLGLRKSVSVEVFTGDTLPYIDNLVDLLVVEQAGAVGDSELMRVLAPGGVLCRRDGTSWTKTIKPRPANIDTWTHFLHDAGNNAVARDEVVGLPRRLQWVAAPRWLRSHETPSGIQSQVASERRLFYIFDEGPIGIVDERLPARWSIVCRDAFNGKQLWRRSLPDWGWRQWAYERFAGKDWTVMRAARTVVPDENQRRLVADGDRLYVTLGYHAPLSILDAATGELIRTVPETAPTREIFAADGLIVVHAAPAGAADKGKPAGDRFIALSRDEGKIVWRHVAPADVKSLFCGIDDGRVVYLQGNALTALRLSTGESLWHRQAASKGGMTLVMADGVILVLGGTTLDAYNGTDGNVLWKQKLPPRTGAERVDLFVVNGTVWPGITSVDAAGQPNGKGDGARVTGFDLHTGNEVKQILAADLRSPEHHHRCYRNKATSHYIISSMEGAEFLDLCGDDHGQNNWLRGACRHGMMPCNGLLYVPTDQCFCEPGAKLLGYAAVAGAAPAPPQPVADAARLERGPAYGIQAAADASPATGADAWPTLRHDAARSGSTPLPVAPDVKPAWRVSLDSPLTQPVVADGRVIVAEIDAHAVHAFDAVTGSERWCFTADGRIDSPPTLYKGLVLFGSADGRVTCLRASDGALVWRFLAAPLDRRLVAYEQLESAWPVHGSVLVDDDGLVYCTAGRSTYLDGGIALYALDPFSGAMRARGCLEGPHRAVAHDRDVAFYVPGANSDVLVSEGGFLYMRQKKLTHELKEVVVDPLSSKGEADVGTHVFSTAGLLDGSWYNRTFWMYTRRWPGFQLANQAPKAGQLLVHDDRATYAVKVFYRRNVHSPMFFPAREGYLLFADANTNEPQIVGETGAVKPLEWLPQSDYSWGRADDMRPLDGPAFGLDKMIGYTRAVPPLWRTWQPVRIRAMVKAGDVLFVAGPPDELDAAAPFDALEGRRGAALLAVAAQDGATLSRLSLESPPVFDGLIAAAGSLYASLEDGTLACFMPKTDAARPQ